MEYIYDAYCMNPNTGTTSRVDTCTRFEDAIEQCDLYGYKFTLVTKPNDRQYAQFLDTESSWEAFRVGLERACAWKDNSKFADEVTDEIFDVHHKHTDASHSPTCNSHLHVVTDGLINNTTKNDPINPNHYQTFLVHEDSHDRLELQWLETKCRESRYRENPDHFISAILLQVDKYMNRAGKKDSEEQDLLKGLWYFKFLVAFIINGKRPIFVKDVEDILKR